MHNAGLVSNLFQTKKDFVHISILVFSPGLLGGRFNCDYSASVVHAAAGWVDSASKHGISSVRPHAWVDWL